MEPEPFQKVRLDREQAVHPDTLLPFFDYAVSLILMQQ